MATILSSKNKKVASPYVVVLGGDRAAKADSAKEELPERSVYTVIPHVRQEVNRESPVEFRETEIVAAQPKLVKKTPTFPSLKKDRDILADHTTELTESDVAIPAVARNPFGMRFMRDLTKKTLLKTPFTVLLPRYRKMAVGIAILVLIIGIPLSFGFFNNPQPVVTSGVVVTQGTNALLAQVGKSIVLPVNELPLVTIATTDDIKRLNLPDAKPGNKILIFQKAGQIVVYDAESDKVIGVVSRTAP